MLSETIGSSRSDSGSALRSGHPSQPLPRSSATATLNRCPSATYSSSDGRSVKPTTRKFEGWTRRMSAVRSPIAAA